MKLLKNNFMKKIIISMFIAMLLILFAISPYSQATSSKTQMKDGEFYYSGVGKGGYVPGESIISWLLKKIGEIVDFLIGLMTMGGRMAIVGWTAIMEELLTSILNATTGVPMEVDVDSTSMDGLVKTSNNVTLEAIVYNKVPIFNINLFEKSKRECLSGTGHYFVKCEACAEDDDEDGFCRMEECKCDNCLRILKENGYIEENAITIVREKVRMWYYVIRLIAMVAMLCVLIFVGIKMAITNAVQEKAECKRMLIDWVVGMILLFSIQYLMIGMINLNQTLVNVVKKAETGVTEVVKKEFAITTKKNEDIEISIYQAVRTRAYDAKLINGTTGMVMYATLVFMAYKYALIYFKRYFSIIVLTLMAPGVAFAYAIQKVMTGKSTSFSNWLQEYFINVIIQFVHALIYTSFISVSLVISLNSISGMIIAFCFMHFMADADKLFRKIFKMTGGSGSIAEDNLNNSNPKDLINNVKSAAGFMTINNLMGKNPVNKAIKMPLKVAGTEAVLLGSRIKDKLDEKNKDKNQQKADVKNTELKKIAEQIKSAREKITTGKVKENFAKAFGMNGPYDSPSSVLGSQGEMVMEEELAALEKDAYGDVLNSSDEDREQAEQRYEEIKAIRENFDNLTTLSTSDVLKAHIGKFFDSKNYYEYDYSKVTEEDIEKMMDKKDGHTRGDDETEEQYKARRKKAIDKLARRRKYGAFGKREYDIEKNKWVRRKMTGLIREQLKSENLLGFTSADKKLAKETIDLFKGTLIGMGSILVGVGTLVTNPAVGMGLLANGFISRINLYDKLGFIDPNTDLKPVTTDKNKRFSFGRFDKGAKRNIVASAASRIEGEKNRAVVQNVKKNHRNLYNAMTLGGIGITAIGTLGAVGVAPIAVGIGVTSYIVGKVGRKGPSYSNYSLMGRISKQHFKEIEAKKKELIKDEISMSAMEGEIEFKKKFDALIVTMEAATKSQQEIIDAENSRQAEISRNEELGVKREEILATDKGRIVLQVPQIKHEHQIIEEAVTEVILERAVNSEITETSFSEPSDTADVKEKILEKLKQQGSEVSLETIADIDSKIASTARKVLKGEPKDATNLEESSSPKATTPTVKVSSIEQTIIQEAIKDVIKTGQAAIAEEITEEKVVQAVEKRKREITSHISAEATARKLQEEKGRLNPDAEHSSTTRVREKKSQSLILDILSNNSSETETATAPKTPEQLMASAISVSDDSRKYIEQTLIQIRTLNAPPTEKKEEDRKADKKKRIEALSSILITAAKNGSIEEGSVDTPKYKSPDDVIQEIFQNTAEREQATALVSQVIEMRKLNMRGEMIKMSSRSRQYQAEKKKSEKRKAYMAYPDLVKESEKADDIVVNMEAYGPVTDVVSLIKSQNGIHENKKK